MPGSGYPKEGRLLCRVPLQGHNYLILLVLRRTSNHSPNPSPIIGKGLNRSACRSYIKVSSTHQRVGMFFYNRTIRSISDRLYERSES